MDDPTDDAAHILIVDDDLVDVRAVTRALRKHRIGNPIAVAGDGLEALDRLRGENGKPRLPWPYIVLLDLNMPRMNGLEFLAELRRDPELTQAIVFMLTTSDEDRDKVAAYRNHVAGYILKSNAGADFIDLVSLLEKFVITVRFPKEARRYQAA